ncbi:MAG: hypothetical protein GXP62_05775 [Oligoflexia bacterium]|nr:hypothetical protein [Oligoflexia bacterium]
MLLLLALVTSSLAATLTVADDGSGTYTAIQDAIDAATSGDTISVAGGTYTECIDFAGKNLTIAGAGSSSTTLNGASSCTNAVSLSAGEPERSRPSVAPPSPTPATAPSTLSEPV